jgi:DtxR family transcriptional regulator, Mn-dependent transcriptional regulator
MKYSASKENYLKAIFHLQSQDGVVTTNELAGELQTRAASVTDMLKKLKDQKLLIYEKYRGFKLSAEGRKVAIQIIRKHRLWEYFLVEKLQFGWDEVHEIAEELEHISSKKLIDKLDEYLGFPKSDPHGDPIPDSSGKFERVEQINLLELPVNHWAEISSVTDQSAEILELLRHKNLAIGTRLEIKKKFSFDNSLEVRIKNQPSVTISEEVAKNIFVKYDQQN